MSTLDEVIPNISAAIRRNKAAERADMRNPALDCMPNIRDAAMERGLGEDEPIEVQGVKGVRSKPFRKRFRNLPAYRRWMDTPEAEDYTVNYIQRA